MDLVACLLLLPSCSCVFSALSSFVLPQFGHGSFQALQAVIVPFALLSLPWSPHELTLEAYRGTSVLLSSSIGTKLLS